MCSLYDRISFEQYGKRAVVLCTVPFEVTVQNIARVMGIPDYPFVSLPHPIGSCSSNEIKMKVKLAADQAISILPG
jgi:hypothetical protein